MSMYNHSCVPGTYVRIPERLLKFRDQYKVIGKNTFVKNTKKATPSKTIEQELYALFDKHHPGDAPPTWAALMKLTSEKKHRQEWLKCTPAQVEDYKKARAPYDKFVADTLAFRQARLVRQRTAAAKQAIATLTSQGYIVRAPLGGDSPDQLVITLTHKLPYGVTLESVRKSLESDFKRGRTIYVLGRPGKDGEEFEIKAIVRLP